jgi:hypothetical protein
MMGLPQPNNPMLLSVETPRPPRPTLPVNGQRRPDLVAPEHLLPGSKSAEPLGGPFVAPAGPPLTYSANGL